LIFLLLGITNIIDIPVNTTYVRVTQISSGNDRYYLGKILSFFFLLCF
jgi:hypothetical protein